MTMTMTMTTNGTQPRPRAKDKVLTQEALERWKAAAEAAIARKTNKETRR